MEIEIFEDGTSVEWFSRESLLYREKDCAVQIPFDIYKISFFKAGRKIFLDSFDNWEEYPDGHTPEIDVETKKDIISKVAEYYQKRKIKVQFIDV